MTNVNSTIKNAQHADAAGNKRAKRKITPPIPYERPTPKELRKDEYMTFKLRTVPDKSDSPTFELTVPFFSTGTVEEWILVKQKITKVLAGLNATTGPTKYSITRSLLRGRAATTFTQAAQGKTETNENYKDVLNTVSRSIFPPRAAQTQRRYMRRYIRKPKEISARDHVARIVELNSYFDDFPLDENGDTVERLETDEILDNLDFGNPNAWQKQMILQNFDPVSNTLDDFVAFCERLEQADTVNEFNNNSNSNKNTKSTSSTTTTGGGKSKRKRDSKDCLLHGKDCGHSTDECRTLKAQAKNMKATYDAQTREGKRKLKEKHELNALIAEAVNDALEAKQKKRRTARRATERELNAFNNLEISSKGTISTDDESDVSA
mgnify:CR=1 FL=1